MLTSKSHSPPEYFSPLLSIADVSAITGQGEGIIRSWFTGKNNGDPSKKLKIRRATENERSCILIYYKDLQKYLLDVLCWPVDYIQIWYELLPQEEQERFLLAEKLHKESMEKKRSETQAFPMENEFS